MNNSLEKQDQTNFLESPMQMQLFHQASYFVFGFVICLFCFLMLFFFDIAYRNYRY
jgi:hypothetical protein